MKMRSQNKLSKIEEYARKKAKDDHERFWSQFSREELQKIIDLDPEQMEKLKQLGDEKIERAYQLALTEDELKAYLAKLDAVLNNHFPAMRILPHEHY